MPAQKNIEPEQALQRARRLCASRDYCAADIEEKLLQWGTNTDNIPEIIESLTKEKFLDDHRFAIHFVNDKFKFNKWGKIKIRFELKRKHISESIIKEALANINPGEYFNLLEKEITLKKKSIKNTDDQDLKAKLFRFASSRGFEPALIMEILNS